VLSRRETAFGTTDTWEAARIWGSVALRTCFCRLVPRLGGIMLLAAVRLLQPDQTALDSELQKSGQLRGG
jgi:hypothetical protein